MPSDDKIAGQDPRTDPMKLAGESQARDVTGKRTAEARRTNNAQGKPWKQAGKQKQPKTLI